jgi:hypothetical protein
MLLNRLDCLKFHDHCAYQSECGDQRVQDGAQTLAFVRVQQQKAAQLQRRACRTRFPSVKWLDLIVGIIEPQLVVTGVAVEKLFSRVSDQEIPLASY